MASTPTAWDEVMKQIEAIHLQVQAQGAPSPQGDVPAEGETIRLPDLDTELLRAILERLGNIEELLRART